MDFSDITDVAECRYTSCEGIGPMKLPADKAKEVDALKLDPRRRRMLESVLADHPTLTVAEAHEMLVAFDGA